MGTSGVIKKPLDLAVIQWLRGSDGILTKQSLTAVRRKAKPHPGGGERRACGERERHPVFLRTGKNVASRLPRSRDKSGSVWEIGSRRAVFRGRLKALQCAREIPQIEQE